MAIESARPPPHCCWIIHVVESYVMARKNVLPTRVSDEWARCCCVCPATSYEYSGWCVLVQWIPIISARFAEQMSNFVKKVKMRTMFSLACWDEAISPHKWGKTSKVRKASLIYCISNCNNNYVVWDVNKSKDERCCLCLAETNDSQRPN